MNELTASNLTSVLQNIADHAVSAGRNGGDIKLVGVSKFHPPESIVEAVRAGLKDIGESRVQEVEAKKPIVEKHLQELGVDPSTVRWHMIGHLQSNKAARAAALFDVIHSVDSVKLARKISDAAKQLSRHVDLLIEVNTSGEASKSGIAPDELDGIVAETSDLPSVKIIGLMTIAPLTSDKSLISEAFRSLFNLRTEIAKTYKTAMNWELSMGMSGDYDIAISEGATIVRIGTAIFGTRPSIKEA